MKFEWLCDLARAAAALLVMMLAGGGFVWLVSASGLRLLVSTPNGYRMAGNLSLLPWLYGLRRDDASERKLVVVDRYRIQPGLVHAVSYLAQWALYASTLLLAIYCAAERFAGASLYGLPRAQLILAAAIYTALLPASLCLWVKRRESARGWRLVHLIIVYLTQSVDKAEEKKCAALIWELFGMAERKQKAKLLERASHGGGAEAGPRRGASCLPICLLRRRGTANHAST